MIQLACLSDRHQVEAPRLIGTASQPNQVSQYGEGVDFPIVAKSLDEGLSGRFIIAMQGQFEMSFGLQDLARCGGRLRPRM